jgi:hypothetical protein
MTWPKIAFSVHGLFEPVAHGAPSRVIAVPAEVDIATS